MKIYFANMFGAKGLEQYLKHKIDILAAFPSFPKSGIKEKPLFCDSLFVDSGAFGKHSKKVDIDSYIKFIKENESLIDIYANLDVIGDPVATYKNQRTMEKAGLNPLPVFHYKSDPKWIQRYINKGHDYISLGGMVPINGNQLRYWLDDIWENYLLTTNRRARVKVHGFGLQYPDFIQRYPWYSIDAASVHIMARYGGIYTPWGTLKINPKVNSREMGWQIKTPKVLEQIQEWVDNLELNFSFESARENNTQGTLRRCAISIQYLSNYFQELSSMPLQKNNTPKLF